LYTVYIGKLILSCLKYGFSKVRRFGYIEIDFVINLVSHVTMLGIKLTDFI